MSPTPPEPLTFGTVAGTFFSPPAGPGDTPDPLAGLRVTFRPILPTRVSDPDGLVGPEPVETVTTALGVLRMPDGTPVRLATGWYWVTYKAPNGNFNLTPHEILVKAEHTADAPFDLTDELPIGQAPSPSQYAELKALIEAIVVGGGDSEVTQAEFDTLGGLLATEVLGRIAGDADLDDTLTTVANATAAHVASTSAHGISDPTALALKTDPRFTDARAPLPHTSAAVTDWQEAVQDALAGFFNVTGASVSYNDAGDQMVITVPPDTNTTDPEAVRDAIGAAIVTLGNLGHTINDAGDTITFTTTATVNATDAALRDRGSHTGFQGVATVTGLQAALDALTEALGGKAPALGPNDRYVTPTEKAAIHSHPALPGPDQYVFAAVDTPNATVAAVDATGLAFPTLADGTWEVEVVAIVTSADQATGARVGIGTPPAGATVYIGGSATGANAAAMSGFWPSMAQLPYASPSGGASSSVSPYVGAIYKGVVIAAGMAGPLPVTIQSEIAASSVSIKAGSYIRYRRIG